jgi:secretion/DNA translocation related CpaE-like protein
MAELSDAAEASSDTGRRGQVVGVIAGRGGAGASVFATALAQASTGMSEALLIDADPWSGGIDLILGSEGDTGLRWPDLAMQGGRLSYPALRDALPQRGGVTVLSGGRTGGDIDAAPLGAVIDAGSRGGATVICDLPRRSTGAVETVLDAADLVVVMAPADVRSCAAAAAIVQWVSAVNPNAGVVVRGPSPVASGRPTSPTSSDCRCWPRCGRSRVWPMPSSAVGCACGIDHRSRPRRAASSRCCTSTKRPHHERVTD